MLLPIGQSLLRVGVGIAIEAKMRASIVLAYVFGLHAAASLALAGVFPVNLFETRPWRQGVFRRQDILCREQISLLDNILRLHAHSFHQGRVLPCQMPYQIPVYASIMNDAKAFQTDFLPASSQSEAPALRRFNAESREANSSICNSVHSR